MELSNYSFINTSFIILYALTVTQGGVDYRTAKPFIEEYRRPDYTKGEAPILWSKLLAQEAENLACTSVADWNIDQNGSKMVLTQFVKAPRSGIKLALKCAIDNLAIYAGLIPRYPSGELNRVVQISNDIEYQTEDTAIRSGLQGLSFFAQVPGDGNNFVIMKKSKLPNVQTILRNEADVLKEIGNHPGIVKCLNAGETNDVHKYAIVFEMMLADLSEMMVLCGENFSLKTSILITKQIIEATRHIHSKNFVHRDIKLENIIVVLSGNKYIVKLIDFGVVKRYQIGQDLVAYEKTCIGSLRTMSPNAHNGFPPRPHDDIWSIVFAFIDFVRGYLPWDGICQQIVDLKERQDKKTDKIKAEELELYDRLAKLKKQEVVNLANHYPELEGLVNQLLFPKPDFNYDLTQDCFDDLMIKHGIANDGVMDWEERLQFLLQPSKVVKIGIGADYNDGWCFVFLLQKMFASVEEELRKFGTDVRVLEELNSEAMLMADPSTKNSSNRISDCFETKIFSIRSENLTLNDFQQKKDIEQLMMSYKILLVGFGYYYGEKEMIFISIIIRPAADVLKSKDVQCTVTWQKNIAAATYLRKMLRCEKQSQTNQVVHVPDPRDASSSLTHYICLVFNNLPHNVKLGISRNDLVKMGYFWNSPANSQLIVTFRRQYNFLELFEAECAAKKVNSLSWSADESLYGSTTTLGISKNGSSYTHVVSVQGASSQLAVQLALSQVIVKLPTLNLLNFRFQWEQNSSQKYHVIIIQDSYYSKASEIYQKNDFTAFKPLEYQSNWTVADAGRKMRQLANTVALYTTLVQYTVSLFKSRDGIITFGIEIHNTTLSVGGQIEYCLNFLNTMQSNHYLSEINPHDVSSVTFGYAITADGWVKGVSIYETYCYEALHLINSKRTTLDPPKQLLKLHKDNFELAETYRSKYKSLNPVQRLFQFLGVDWSQDRKVTSANETSNEALWTYVGEFLEKSGNSDYKKVMVDDISEISFVIFKTTSGSNWKINIKVYKNLAHV